MSTRGACVVVLLALAFPATAHADSAALEGAKQHTTAGRDAYNAGRYAEAEREFLDAYALVPEPALLYNLGRCRAALGRDRDAAETFERYAALITDPEQRAAAQSLAVEARRRATEREAAAAEAARVAPSLGVAASPRRRFFAPASTALGATAVALTLASIGTGAAAQSTYDDLSARCAADCSSEAARGDRLRVASIVTLSLGGAAAVGGAIAFALEWRRHRR
jgi:tetratricopeptide (TPR) repeat protein